MGSASVHVILNEARQYQRAEHVVYPGKLTGIGRNAAERSAESLN